jgi:hypothetical protein
LVFVWIGYLVTVMSAFVGSGGGDMLSLVGGLVFNTQFGGVVQAIYQVGGNGIESSTPGGINNQWCTPTVNAPQYEVRVTLGTGVLNGNSAGVWYSASTYPSWYAQATGHGADSVVDIFVEIRRIGTTTILASCSVEMEAQCT